MGCELQLHPRQSRPRRRPLSNEAVYLLMWSQNRMLYQSRVFTPAAIETIRDLASQGKSASEIADVIGSTAASVRTRCCQLKIKLGRRGRPSLLVPQSRHIPVQRPVFRVRPAVYAALNRKAFHMQKSVVELVQMLLEVIVSDDLYEAVLDIGAASPRDSHSPMASRNN